MREGRESSGIVGIARSGIPCRMHLLNTSDTQRHAHQRWRLPGLAAATTAVQARAAIAGLEQLAQQRVGRGADVRAEQRGDDRAEEVRRDQPPPRLRKHTNKHTNKQTNETVGRQGAAVRACHGYTVHPLRHECSCAV
jgi:hypothetical protein